MTTRFSTFTLCFIVWLESIGATYAISPGDLRGLIKPDGEGRIVSIDYDDRKHGYSQRNSPIRKKHLELAKEILLFSQQRSGEELKELLGNPRIIEKRIPSNIWTKESQDIDEMWFYTCGPNTWGITVVICLLDGRCTRSFITKSAKLFAYIDWKVESYRQIAKGLTSDEILKILGKPDERKEAGSILNQSYEKEWFYKFLDIAGVSLWFRHNKCFLTERVDFLH